MTLKPISITFGPDQISRLPNRTNDAIYYHGIGRYRDDYLLLLDAAKLLRENGSMSAMIGIAAIAYSWMPTILKHWPTHDSIKCLVDWAKGVSGIQEAAQDIRSGRPANLHVVNRSLVGTSKFLHLLRPDIFPIWDSVVASHWGLRRGVYERPEIYAQYLDVVATIALQPCATQLRGILYPGIDGISDVRRIEYALFLTSPDSIRKTKS